MKNFCGGMYSSVSSSSNRSYLSPSSSSSSSLWWNDLISCGNKFDVDIMVDHCRFTVGNGFTTPFWKARWWDSWSFMEGFPDLHSLSYLNFVAVTSMCVCVCGRGGGGWVNRVW